MLVTLRASSSGAKFGPNMSLTEKNPKKPTSVKESDFTNYFNMATADCHTGINGYKNISPRTSSGIYICRTLIFSVFICFKKF